MEVSILPLRQTLDVRSGENLLEALRNREIPISYSCMAGRCGTCRCRIVAGNVLVTSSGCLGPCEQGPTVVVYPDATWYSQVKEADVPAILDEHIGKGTPVERLKPNSVWG